MLSPGNSGLYINNLSTPCIYVLLTVNIVSALSWTDFKKKEKENEMSRKSTHIYRPTRICILCLVTHNSVMRRQEILILFVCKAVFHCRSHIFIEIKYVGLRMYISHRSRFNIDIYVFGFFFCLENQLTREILKLTR